MISLLNKIKGIALRSLKEPGTAYNDPTIGKDPQPSHMKGFMKNTSDNGDVHIDSGISNRAFYLAALELGGYAWEKAGKIWYMTLSEKLREESNFQNLAKMTSEVAANTYGKGSQKHTAVLKGWKEVGINIK